MNQHLKRKFCELLSPRNSPAVPQLCCACRGQVELATYWLNVESNLSPARRQSLGTWADVEISGSAPAPSEVRPFWRCIANCHS